MQHVGGRLQLEETCAVVDAALDAGVTFFDTAEIYGNGGGSERLLGEILEGRRDRIVLATKFAWEPGEGPERASRVGEGQFDRIEALARFAEERGHSLHELAVGALVSTPGIGSVIAGATKPEQVRVNAATASWQLSQDDLDALP